MARVRRADGNRRLGDGAAKKTDFSEKAGLLLRQVGFGHRPRLKKVILVFDNYLGSDYPSSRHPPH